MKKNDPRETGLEIGLLFAKYFLKTDHLHYGLWTDDLSVELQNLPQAQDNHSNFIISHIPRGTKTILDVGSGVGCFAKKLKALGYQVDCVVPSSFQAEQAHALLGESSQIYECSFETLVTEKRYDVVLFSESFQYINLEKALRNSLTVLSDHGHLLICDFFKKDMQAGNVIGGGHKLSKFYNMIAKHPFSVVEDIDITRETAPNFTLVEEFLSEVGFPVWNLIIKFLHGNYPLGAAILEWKYKKKIKKINRVYFSGARNAESFTKFKSYRLLLYEKTGSY